MVGKPVSVTGVPVERTLVVRVRAMKAEKMPSVKNRSVNLSAQTRAYAARKLFGSEGDH